MIKMVQLVDVSNDTCPMTFVRARLRLDKMPSGEILEIRFRGQEPRQNLHRSLTEQGHTVIFMEYDENEGGRLLVRKNG